MDAEDIGKKFGFVLMFFISTLLLFLVLNLLKKLPENWGYLHIVGLVFLITLTGVLIKKLLK